MRVKRAAAVQCSALHCGALVRWWVACTQTHHSRHSSLRIKVEASPNQVGSSFSISLRTLRVGKIQVLPPLHCPTPDLVVIYSLHSLRLWMYCEQCQWNSHHYYRCTHCRRQRVTDPHLGLADTPPFSPNA